MSKELVKIDKDIITTKNLFSLNNDMVQFNPEERCEIINKTYELMIDLYPTASNYENYLMKKTPEEIAEDFDFKVVGETIDVNTDGEKILATGGMSKDYLMRVQKMTEFYSWKSFWLIINELDENNLHFPNNLPTFDYHPDMIHKYVYDILKSSDALNYLKALRLFLNKTRLELPEVLYDKTDGYLKEQIIKLKEILE